MQLNLFIFYWCLAFVHYTVIVLDVAVDSQPEEEASYDKWLQIYSPRILGVNKESTTNSTEERERASSTALGEKQETPLIGSRDNMIYQSKLTNDKWKDFTV